MNTLRSRPAFWASINSMPLELLLTAHLLHTPLSLSGTPSLSRPYRTVQLSLVYHQVKDYSIGSLRVECENRLFIQLTELYQHVDRKDQLFIKLAKFNQHMAVKISCFFKRQDIIKGQDDKATYLSSES
ncbi:hypothetical protein RRG08_019756 [Elysia crispata]|uniref:Uncharacterized protein n=1 Tax=Elysia crispata TaxID=231223 RepID=A0AAE1CTN4_9GAST|nr:hypothetical protein RRG08_019756 [Elysia crispata]